MLKFCHSWAEFEHLELKGSIHSITYAMVFHMAEQRPEPMAEQDSTQSGTQAAKTFINTSFLGVTMTGINAEQSGTLSIRQFAEVAGVSHTEVRRQMALLSIEGEPQGKGKPTLLDGAEQMQLEQALGIKRNEPAESVDVEVFGPGIEIYQPGGLTTRRFDNSEIRRQQTRQLGEGLNTVIANKAGLRTAVLEVFAEQGEQLGHEANAVMMSRFMRTVEAGQRDMGKHFNVVGGGDVAE